jgi:cyclopropane-fatty-acyl-phospholipid synthase
MSTNPSIPFPAVRSRTSLELEELLTTSLRAFPWRIAFHDWEGAQYSVGRGNVHWAGDWVDLFIKTRSAGRNFLGLRGFDLHEDFVRGEIDVGGNFILLTWVRLYLNLELSWPVMLWRVLNNRAFQFQNISRASINVASHYDLNEDFINTYLDCTYHSYSCGMFEDPEDLNVPDLLRRGEGNGDSFDSLEKAQFTKYKDAANFASPLPGECVLDIGCGYGGQLRVGAELFPASQWVGWTHSRNQIAVGQKQLALSGVADNTHLQFGDYRQDDGIYDHILSTGMVSHVGPRGLIPYIKQVRKRIRKGGRYMHHAIMNPWSCRPLDSYMGVAFCKKYVWPGFHWFSVGEHYAALERNGFRILGEKNLRLHYAKTTAAWYLRMMEDQERLRKLVGEATFRAWQIYLAGSSGGFSSDQIEIHRIYTEAR